MKKVLLFTLMASACDDTEFPAVNRGTGDSSNVEGIIENNCQSCHSASAMLGDLDLETDLCDLVGLESVSEPGETLVIEGDHENSILWLRVETDDTNYIMPSAGQLDDDSINVIADWIDTTGCE